MWGKCCRVAEKLTVAVAGETIRSLAHGYGSTMDSEIQQMKPGTWLENGVNGPRCHW